MLPACILEGSIHKGNNYWFGIIPFIFTSNSILQILTCISRTHSILFTVGFIVVSVNLTPFQGLEIWLSADKSQAAPRWLPQVQMQSIYSGVGCRLLHPAYSASFGIHFWLNHLRDCAQILLVILYRMPKPHKTPNFGCYARTPGDE